MDTGVVEDIQYLQNKIMKGGEKVMKNKKTKAQVWFDKKRDKTKAFYKENNLKTTKRGNLTIIKGTYNGKKIDMESALFYLLYLRKML